MIAIIDNYDSFTYNLVQRLGEMDRAVEIEVYRNDQIEPDALAARRPSHLIISPGPCTPNEAGISVECVRRFGGRIPLLGVCLGHQAIGQAYGANIIRANRLMHGKTDQIEHDGRGVFTGIPNPFRATRYHSLIIEPDSLPTEFEVSAWSSTDQTRQEIMAIRHRQLPLIGVQFHPESFLTDYGTNLLENFLRLSAPSN